MLLEEEGAWGAELPMPPKNCCDDDDC